MARSSSRPGDFSLMSKQVGKRNCNIIGGTDVDCCGSSAGSSTIPSLQELAINSQHGLPSNNILAIMKMCSDDPTNNDTRARVSEFIKQYLPPDEATDPLIDYFIVVFKNLHEANHVYPRGDDKIEASSDLEALLLKECNKLSPSVDRVKRIISLGSDLNALGSRGQTALMIVVALVATYSRLEKLFQILFFPLFHRHGRAGEGMGYGVSVMQQRDVIVQIPAIDVIVRSRSGSNVLVPMLRVVAASAPDL